MKVKDLLITNANECCVVCLSRRKKMCSIYEKKSDSIVDKIAFATGVQFTEHINMPSQICNTCLKTLVKAHKFKTQCLVAENTFRDLIESKIKTEDATEYETYESYDDFDDSKDYVKVETGDTKILDHDSDTIKNITEAETIKPVPNENSTNIHKTVKPYKRRWAPPGPGKCKICLIRFDTKGEAREHKVNNHQAMNSLVCVICGKISHNKVEMYYHNRTHLARYKCAHCDYATGIKSSLIKHIDTHMGVRNFQCQHCGKTFTTSSSRSSHIRRLHLKVLRYNCHLCKKLFFDKTKLAIHIDTHNNIKRFECEVCLSRFTRREHWKRHMLVEHCIEIARLRPGRRPGANTQLSSHPYIFSKIS